MIESHVRNHTVNNGEGQDLNQGGSDSQTLLLSMAHCLLLAQEGSSWCARPDCQSASLPARLESFGEFMETELLVGGLVSQRDPMRNQIRHLPLPHHPNGCAAVKVVQSFSPQPWTCLTLGCYTQWPNEHYYDTAFVVTLLLPVGP